MSIATIRLRAEERWQAAALSTRRIPATMALIALGSLIAHLAVIVGAALDSKPPTPPSQEIAVEIVQDVPKQTAETSPPHLDAPKVEATKTEPPRPERMVAARTEPKPAPKPAPEPPPSPATPPSPAKDVAAEEQKLAALQQELAGLKAEQAALRSDTAAETAAARQPATQATGLGPLPDSFQAVALPASADGQGEATSYQEIVFSALAKAKGIGGRQGLPGSAGVHFSLDASGQIVDVELVHKSGVAALDAEALDIVRRAAPFPPPPQGAQRSFDANVTFKPEGPS